MLTIVSVLFCGLALSIKSGLEQITKRKTMGKINHNDALYIEILVLNLYKSDLGKPPLIANADTFETSPIYAAIMIVSYIYAKGLPTEDRQLNDWIGKYELDFNEISEEIPEKLVNNYIRDLEKIVDHYTS